MDTTRWSRWTLIFPTSHASPGPSKLLRMSVLPAASHTRLPGGGVIIAPPAPSTPAAAARPRPPLLKPITIPFGALISIAHSPARADPGNDPPPPAQTVFASTSLRCQVR